MKGCVVKLYPTKEQIIFIEKSFDAGRFVYNKMLEINEKRYKRTGKGLSAYDMHKYLTKLKKGYKFLNEVSNINLQTKCEDLAEGYKKFFKGLTEFPSFKKKNYNPSFCDKVDPQVIQSRIRDNKLKIAKMPAIKFRFGSIPEGKIKRITVKKIAGKEFEEFLEEKNSQPNPTLNN